MRIITSQTKHATWKDLKLAAITKTLDYFLKTGDKIPVSLSNGTELMFIAMQDQNKKWYFVLENCYPADHVMNERNTARGGWAESDMRQWLQTIFELFPAELREVIVPTRIAQRDVDGDTRGTTRISQDNLFLLSMTQVFGNGSWTEYEPDDTRLDYFERRKNRIKESDSGGLSHWWLRSAGSGTGFYIVGTGGSHYYYTANNTNGVVFGFCLES